MRLRDRRELFQTPPPMRMFTFDIYDGVSTCQRGRRDTSATSYRSLEIWKPEDPFPFAIAKLNKKRTTTNKEVLLCSGLVGAGVTQLYTAGGLALIKSSAGFRLRPDLLVWICVFRAVRTGCLLRE